MLIVGLAAAGLGSMPILRGVLLSNVDSTVLEYAQTNIAERLLTWEPSNDSLVFSPVEPQPRTDYVVAIYDRDGNLAASAGGDSDEARPTLPAAFFLEDAFINQGKIIELPSTEGASWHATVVVRTLSVGSYDQPFTQLVALPVSDVNEFVASYLAVFTLVAIIITIAGALGTRWLVTLTFRRLRHVESTAMEIAAGDFSQRMSDIAPGTEIGRLKIAINTMLDRIDGAIDERDATLAQMRRFVGDASHELRTPLVSVRGYAELYRMGALTDTESTTKAMERIEAEARRMGMLVEDLLALTRIEERRDRETGPVDLRPLARDAALDVRAAEPERTVAVVDHTFEALTQPISLPQPEDDRPTQAHPTKKARNPLTRRWRRKVADDAIAPLDVSAPAPSRPVAVPPVVLGDENRIRQVVANLLGNARRYSPPGSEIGIEVGVEPDTETGWIAIVDHGDGVPEAIREKIFERFWRADTSRARETGGSGLGLAIVSSIVNSLGGTVRVTETPGGGATFTVRLRLAPLRPDTDDGADDTTG